MKTGNIIVTVAVVLVLSAGVALVAVKVDGTLIPTLLGFLPSDMQERYATSQVARAKFLRDHPCPAKGANDEFCTGYVITHIVPRVCGGADEPTNLQWQTVEDANARGHMGRRVCDSTTDGGK